MVKVRADSPSSMRLWLGVAVGILLATALTPCAASLLKYELAGYYTSPMLPLETVLVGDMDRDGNDELVRGDSTQVLCIQLTSRSPAALWHSVLDPHGEIVGLWDATGDSCPDLFVRTGPEGGPRSLCCFDLSHGTATQPIYRLGPFLNGCGLWSGRSGALQVAGCFDANGDGRPEIYVVSAPFVRGGEPRRLCAFDGPTGVPLWEYPLGPIALSVSLLPPEGGAQPRVVISTYAPSNGFTAGLTNDSESYVLCLTPQGQLEWFLPVGSVFSGSRAVVADLDADGRTDLLAGLARGNPGSGDEHRPAVLRVDPDSGKVLDAEMLPTGVREMRAVDLDGNGQSEILVVGQDQGAYCLRPDLSVRWSQPHLTCQALVGVADLDRRKGKEIVCYCTPAITVLDHHGRRLLTEMLGSEMLVALMEVHGQSMIVVSTPLLLRVFTVVPPVIPRDVAASAGALIGLAAVSGLGLSLRLWQRRRRSEQVLDTESSQERLLDAMVAFGHGGGSLREIDRLRQILMNWERFIEQLSAEEDPLPALVASFENAVLPDLVLVGARARIARVPPEHWRGLVQRARSASSAMRGLLDAGRSTGSIWVRRALDALDEVDRDLAAIRLHLRITFSTPLQETLLQVLQGRRAKHLAVFFHDPDLSVEPGGRVFVSPVVFRKVLENLLDNAARAVRGCEVREVGIQVDREGSYYRIDVWDTGVGIDREQWESVFEGGRRPGGGFGLLYSRHELARVGGKIFIQASTPGKGTTVRLRLRGSELGDV